MPRLRTAEDLVKVGPKIVLRLGAAMYLAYRNCGVNGSLNNNHDDLLPWRSLVNFITFVLGYPAQPKLRSAKLVLP